MYPYHIGRQKGTIKPLQPTGLTLNKTLLSEKLKLLGYKTHIVGKWHLGFCNKKYTPTKRGFDSFFGYYTGAEEYFNHSRGNGYDFRSNFTVNREARGYYSTDLFTDKSLSIIENHSMEKLSSPLFLYIPYQAVHAPLEAPRSEYQNIQKTGNIPRDIYRAMLSRLDDGVNKIVQKLKTSGMWNNTVLVFSTDNGGAIHEAGSNYPLRGTKGTLFEGGTHGVGFVAGGHLKRSGVVQKELFHITDWYPTLLSAATIGNKSNQEDIDGVDQWNTIQHGDKANRNTMVYNLKIFPVSGAIRVGPYKLMFAPEFNKDGWYNPDNKTVLKQNEKLTFKNGEVVKEYVPIEDTKLMVRIKKISDIYVNGHDIIEDNDKKERSLMKMFNKGNKDIGKGNMYQYIFDKRWPKLKKHLFNVVEDPEERKDLEEVFPEIFEKLRAKARDFYGSFIPRDYPKFSNKGNPKFYDGVWSSGWCQ